MGAIKMNTKTKPGRVLIAVLAASVLGTASAQVPQPVQQAPQQQAGAEEVQPRFVWGILIQMALSKVGGFAWDVFTRWMESRLTGGLDSLTDKMVLGLTASSGARIAPRSAAITTESGAVVGTPDAPLTFDDGKENYQGANFAILAGARGSSDFQARPINAGFKTGERFKLRIVSTFGGELSLENINPRGERRQIYPAAANQVVTLVAGKETFVPIGPDEYFEFTGDAGKEQLLIKLVDPRAVGDRASKAKVYRQDVKYGSNFVQEVPGNTFPHIAQAIELQHAPN
jgi:hypothetical protein